MDAPIIGRGLTLVNSMVRRSVTLHALICNTTSVEGWTSLLAGHIRNLTRKSVCVPPALLMAGLLHHQTKKVLILSLCLASHATSYGLICEIRKWF